MIGISIATKWEWDATLEYYNVGASDLKKYPYGEYFNLRIKDKDVIFYSTGARKVNGIGANQFMISKFNLEKVIVVGTCAGVNEDNQVLDIIVANKALQYDCTVKEIEGLIKQSFVVDIDLLDYKGEYKTGVIGTADRAVVMWKDFLELKENNIDIADTEAGAVAYICKKNNVPCIIIKGISDFPTDESKSNSKQSNDEQINVYLENTPKVMKKIFDSTLEYFI